MSMSNRWEVNSVQNFHLTATKWKCLLPEFSNEGNEMFIGIFLKNKYCPCFHNRLSGRRRYLIIVFCWKIPKLPFICEYKYFKICVINLIQRKILSYV